MSICVIRNTWLRRAAIVVAFVPLASLAAFFGAAAEVVETFAEMWASAKRAWRR